MVANKHISTAMNQHTTIDRLLETVFSTVVHAKEVISRTKLRLSGVVGYVPDSKDISRQCLNLLPRNN
jgi:hypothetical protein